MRTLPFGNGLSFEGRSKSCGYSIPSNSFVSWKTLFFFNSYRQGRPFFGESVLVEVLEAAKSALNLHRELPEEVEFVESFIHPHFVKFGKVIYANREYP